MSSTSLKNRTDDCSWRSVPMINKGNSRGILIREEILLNTDIRRICSAGALKSIILHVLERIYEICATYNIRYCPFRGSLRNKPYIIHALRDIIVLLCFFAANFIVLLTILTRITMHVSYILIEAIRWTQRSLTKNFKDRKHKQLTEPSLPDVQVPE